MSEAPERIWAWNSGQAAGIFDTSFHDNISTAIEYTRTDLIPAMVEAAYRMALEDVAVSYEVNYLLAKRLGIEIPAYHRDIRSLTPPADLVERIKVPDKTTESV